MSACQVRAETPIAPGDFPSAPRLGNPLHPLCSQPFMPLLTCLLPKTKGRGEPGVRVAPPPNPHPRCVLREELGKSRIL